MGAIVLKKKVVGDIIFDSFNIMFICIVVVIAIFPFLNIIAISLSGAGAVMTNKVSIFPIEFTLNTYKKVIENPYIWSSYRNSIFYTIVFVSISLLVTTLAAYPLSKRRLIGRRPILFFITFTTIFHGGMIPTFLVVKEVGLLNSFWALVIPYCITVYNLMLLRTFFEGLPIEVEEAAKIDGLGDLGIMTKIYVPLTLPMYATLFLMLTVTQWNSFFPALLYLNNRAQYPLQIILREIVLLDSQATFTEFITNLNDMPVQQSLKAATIIFVSLPILAIYPFVQKYFVKGMIMGSVKG